MTFKKENLGYILYGDSYKKFKEMDFENTFALLLDREHFNIEKIYRNDEEFGNMDVYKREAIGNIPELQLSVSKLSFKKGFAIGVHSIPPENTYKFHSNGFISSENIGNVVKNYMESIKENKQYQMPKDFLKI